MRRLTTALLAIAILGVAALADDGGDPAAQRALERQAKQSIKIFRKEFASKNLGRRMTAIFDLGRVKHDLVIDELGKQFTKASRRATDYNEDERDGFAQVLGEMDVNVEKAGEYLRDNLERNEDYPEVQLSIIRSIGKLGYKDAFEELKEAAAHLHEEKYKWVTVEVVRTMGKLGDPKCLPFLLWMAEYGGKVEKWATGSVSVDTGASGDTDQRAAEAAWKKKYGHVKPKKPKPPLIRTYMEELKKTVKLLTGQEFKNATEFRRWLIVHAEELGLDPKKLSKDA